MRMPTLLLCASTMSVVAPSSSDGGKCGGGPPPSLPKVHADGRGVASLRPGDDGASSAASDYVSRNEPFVCRACLSAEETEWWNDDSNVLNAAGGRGRTDVELRVRSARRPKPPSRTTDGPTPFRRSGYDAHGHVNVTLSEFLRRYDDGESVDHLYLAQVDLGSVLPGLVEHVPTPPAGLLDAMGPRPAEAAPITLYFGAGGTTTQLHYDSLENFVCVVRGGSKRFELYDPITSGSLLYYDKRHGNASPIPFHDPAAMESDYALAKYALPSKVQIGVGDCLYLPIYWFHSVESSPERVASINWWRQPDEGKKDVLGRLMCGQSHRDAGAKC